MVEINSTSQNYLTIFRAIIPSTRINYPMTGCQSRFSGSEGQAMALIEGQTNKMKKTTILMTLLLSLSLTSFASAAQIAKGQITPDGKWQENEQLKKERLAWWTEARFGMFIHWGLYAIILCLHGSISIPFFSICDTAIS